MKCKNLPVTENIMQEIIVTKVETAGCILCCPKTSDDNVDLYLEFLAALNTKYEQKKKTMEQFLHRKWARFVLVTPLLEIQKTNCGTEERLSACLTALGLLQRFC